MTHDHSYMKTINNDACCMKSFGLVKYCAYMKRDICILCVVIYPITVMR